MSNWLNGLLSLCVNRAPPQENKDGAALNEALIPADEAPKVEAEKPPKEVELPKPEGDTKRKLKTADICLAGVGLWAACWILSILQPILGVTLFVPPMMASGIIFFAGPAPPSPKPFLIGTLGSATVALGALLVLSEILPAIAAQGSAAAMLLMWYKTTNVIFPPAVVLSGSLMVAGAGAAASAGSDHPGLVAMLKFLAFPWLTGHAWLYVVAMFMSKVRGMARIKLAAAAFADKSMTDAQLKEIFKKFDTSGDGTLDTEELKVALRVALGIDLSVDDCNAMISQYDKDGTGTVDVNEFLLICKS